MRLLIAILVLSFAPSVAAAYDVEVMPALDANGDPNLVANFTPDGSLAVPSWQVCDPSCHAGPSGQAFTPGPTAAGTVFRASATYGGQDYAADSPVWQGRVAAVQPPTVTGDLRVGAVVGPVGAAWTGGWPTDYSSTGLVACPTATPQNCHTLLDYRYDGPPPPGTLPSWTSGEYVFATDTRFTQGVPFAGIGYATVGAVPPAVPAQTVAFSAPYGPVAGPPPPKLVLRRTTRVNRRGRATVGRVRCSAACHVHLTALGSRIGFESDVTLSHGGPITVNVPAHMQRHSTVRVSVDDGPVTVRKLTLTWRRSDA